MARVEVSPVVDTWTIDPTGDDSNEVSISEDWPSGVKVNCFTFTHEHREGGRHSVNLPEGLQFKRSEYIGGLAEWLKAAVY